MEFNSQYKKANNDIYKKYIYERYKDLKNANKSELDNNDLSKIFEYYTCIKLTELYKTQFCEYNDIDPNFKEINQMSRNDTGIDCSDLDKTIVQCKLRNKYLTWKECSTFFGSQNVFDNELNKTIVKWEKLIISRNDDCKLSENLEVRKKLFIDMTFSKKEIIEYCDGLINNPPLYPVIKDNFELRDYQLESIDMINNNKKNVIISLPTGTGKNSVIIFSMKNDLKYLILVPRIILMDQLKNEMIKLKPEMKNKIQLIGDGNNIFDETKLITICCFNSVHLIENNCSIFEKIFIDESHHINKPVIYCNEDEFEELNNNDINSDSESDYDDSDSESKDDSEDELVNVKNYTKIIKSLVKYNNNVYLSATIDKDDDFEYYTKDIRDMIDLDYLCDYTIHIPIFEEDITNKNICMHLLKEYKNIIIYCNSQKEGKEINKLMNKLQLKSSEYIDCNTSKKKRDTIIEKYKNGEIPFLVNVRILVEGFDSPITKGVCFMHLPQSKTTLIQIIGRSLRKHESKTMANIILPFSSNDDEKNICNFLKIMAQNDSKIKKSYQNKKLGGYISIENMNEESKDENEVEDKEDVEDEQNNFELKYNMVYDSMGNLQNSSEIWMFKLNKIKEYIDKNNKKPSKNDKNKNIKSLGCWLSNQKINYKNKKYNMLTEEIYNKWGDFINDKKYKIHFLDPNEIWKNNLDKLKEYIDKNNKRPCSKDKDENIKSLGFWISNQTKNYKNKKEIMKNEEIYNKWDDFINDEKYKIHFLDPNEIWKNNLDKLKEYIDQNNKKPYQKDKDKNIKYLGNWIGNQTKNYKNKKIIMKNEEIYKKWDNFINDEKYKIHFVDPTEIWKNNLDKVKEYIDQNNKKPLRIDKNINIKSLGIWISDQIQNYKNKKKIMKNEEIYKKWDNFINEEEYKIYFKK